MTHWSTHQKTLDHIATMVSEKLYLLKRQSSCKWYCLRPHADTPDGLQSHGSRVRTPHIARGNINGVCAICGRSTLPRRRFRSGIRHRRDTQSTLLTVFFSLFLFRLFRLSRCRDLHCSLKTRGRRSLIQHAVLGQTAGGSSTRTKICKHRAIFHKPWKNVIVVAEE